MKLISDANFQFCGVIENVTADLKIFLRRGKGVSRHSSSPSARFILAIFVFGFFSLPRSDFNNNQSSRSSRPYLKLWKFNNLVKLYWILLLNKFYYSAHRYQGIANTNKHNKQTNSCTLHNITNSCTLKLEIYFALR